MSAAAPSSSAPPHPSASPQSINGAMQSSHSYSSLANPSSSVTVASQLLSSIRRSNDMTMLARHPQQHAPITRPPPHIMSMQSSSNNAPINPMMLQQQQHMLYDYIQQQQQQQQQQQYHQHQQPPMPSHNPHAAPSHVPPPYMSSSSMPPSNMIQPLQRPHPGMPLSMSMPSPFVPAYPSSGPSYLYGAPIASALPAAAPATALPMKKKRKAYGSAIDDETKANRSRKHNEAEVRRRQRLKTQLLELANVIKSTSMHKSHILRCAVDTVRHNEATIAALQGVLSSALDELASLGRNTRHYQVQVEDILKERVKQEPKSGKNDDSGSDSDSLDEKMKREQVDTSAPNDSANNAASTNANNQANNHINNNQANDQTNITVDSTSKPMPSSSDTHSSSSHTNSASPAQSLSPRPSSQIQQFNQPPSTSINSQPHFAPASLSFHSRIFHSANVAMDIIDCSGHFVDCNTLFEEWMGYKKSELCSHPTTFLGLTHPDSLEVSVSVLKSLLTGRQNVARAIKKYVTASGRIRLGYLTCWLIRADETQPAYIMAIVEDAHDVQALPFNHELLSVPSNLPSSHPPIYSDVHNHNEHNPAAQSLINIDQPE